MKHTHSLRLRLTGLFLGMALILNGCSIFTPVGNVVSQGYDNTVSYFNVYYNAQRLFGEAEDEIQTAALLARGKETEASTPAQASQIPGGAKQKLGQVIDKCSNILAFHATSSLVDDALLLIGKSFYYQAEYLKAERKFAELLAQYPNSGLILETQLWYARTLEKVGKLDEGIRMCDATISLAESKGEDEIAVQARQLLGTLYRQTHQMEKAIDDYEKVIASSSDDEMKSDALMSLGDSYFSMKEYAKAAEAYLRTGDYTSDIFLNYRSRLQAAIAYREIGEYKKGLALDNSLIDDFRNKEYLPSLFFERANNYAANGRQDDAIEEYTYIDTTYPRTEYATRSAFHLGQIYENQLGNYQQALRFYTEVNSATGQNAIPEGRRKFTALTRYFDSYKKLGVLDSLLAVLNDTIQRSDTASVAVTVVDSLTHAVHDSVQPKDHRAVRPKVLMTADSIHILKSIAAQDLGDIFYSEIVLPDSAYFWYVQSFAWSYNRQRSPRVLYILAELSRTFPDKRFPTPSEYYRQLDRDFPESNYAEEARRFLGKASAIQQTDTAAISYVLAEKQIDTKEYHQALKTLQTIAHSYPASPFAAKSEYAIGWILEHHLALTDSARAQYKRVAKNYAGTPYASIIAKRILDTTVQSPAKPDTSASAKGPIVPAPDQPRDEDEIVRPRKKPSDPIKLEKE